MRTRKVTAAEEAAYESAIRPVYQAMDRICLPAHPDSPARYRAHLRLCRIGQLRREALGLTIVRGYGLRAVLTPKAVRP